MGNADGRIDGSEEPKGSQDLIVGIGTGMDYGRRKTIKRECDKSADVAVKPASHPPERRAQTETGKKKRGVQKKQHVGQLMTHLPGGGILRLAGEDALNGERQARQRGSPACRRECCRSW